MRTLLAARWVRYLALSTLLVVLACAGVGFGCLASFEAANARVAGLTARGVGELTTVDGSSVRVVWRVDGVPHSAVVALDSTPPRPGTRTQVAYDPHDPRRAIIPRAAVLRTADRAAAGMGFAVAFAVGVLGYGGWLLASRGRLFPRSSRGAPSRRVPVRRIRLQRGLLRRSWLELEHPPQRWFPVHFDPALVTLPTPSELRVYGDPLRARFVGFETEDGVQLYPSGPARSGEPRGVRVDNPSRPDAAAVDRAAVSARLRRQVVADLPRLAVAPLVGVVWAVLDGSGFAGWLAATVLVATLSLWLAAVRGSDPS